MRSLTFSWPAIFMTKKPFRIAMIPSSTDGVNYYRLATWAFEMRKYKNTLVDLLWFKYEIDPSRPHPWQEDMQSDEAATQMLGLTIGQQIRGEIDHACERADVVVWHPMYYDWSLEFFLEMQHKHQKPFVVEMDDNYVDVPQWNEAYHSFKNGQSYRRIALDCMRNADAVIVTTSHLADTYAEVNDNIYIVPNSLDFKGDRKFIGWDRVSTRKHKGVRIGWIGGRSHFNDLMMVAPALREILVIHPETTLCLVNSAMKPSCESLGIAYPFKGIETRVHYADRSVAINRYASFAASFGFDIGIAPLVDCNFNRSKSNLRWLEYSALSTPTVASPVSHFVETIQSGVDGILVKDNSLDDWVTQLGLLVRDKEKRTEIGRNAGRRVRRDFNVMRNAPRYLRMLKEIANTNVPEFEEEVALV